MKATAWVAAVILTGLVLGIAIALGAWLAVIFLAVMFVQVINLAARGLT